ncbi:MAG: sodium-independent anion transporter [Geminicoccaceae bacterium]
MRRLVRQLGAILPSLLLQSRPALGLRLLRRLAPRAPGPLLAVAVALLADRLLGLEATGVATVGAVPTGPPPGLALLARQRRARRPAAASARHHAGELRQRHRRRAQLRRPCRRLGRRLARDGTGFAAADLLAGLLSGFPVTGAGNSRTAINQLVGSRTQLAGLAAALALAAASSGFGDLLAALPVPALAAVLVPRPPGTCSICARWRSSGRSTATVAFAARPDRRRHRGRAAGPGGRHRGHAAPPPADGGPARDALLGRVPGRPGLHKLHRTPAAPRAGPGALSARGQPPPFFNADHVHRRMRQIIDAQPPETRRFIIVGAGIGMLDSTAAAMLDQFREELAARGVALGFAALHQPQRLLERAGVLGRLEPGMVRESLAETVEGEAMSTAIVWSPSNMAAMPTRGCDRRSTLLARVPLADARSLVDLGCGTGVLFAALPRPLPASHAHRRGPLARDAGQGRQGRSCGHADRGGCRPVAAGGARGSNPRQCLAALGAGP